MADATLSTEVLICVSCDSRAEIESLVTKAGAGGATTPRPAQDNGFMYQHGYTDLDGHIWELVHMSGAPTDATK